MADNRLHQIIRRFAATLRENVQADAELLERFIRQRDESAFESILRNHGRMVLGVCRRVLGNEQDAEDAFQAVFLVLARRAGSLREPGRLGNWLFGVAYRTASSAKKAGTKRRNRETAAALRPVEVGDTDAELREVLDYEIAKLPAKHREIIVLCDLEGQPGKKVAEQLGCPEGTVKSRLARARAMLAKRLTRHGLAAGLASLVVEQAGTAGLPVSLIQSTARAAVVYASGKLALAGMVTAEVATLTKGVLKTMFIVKMKAVVAGVLVLAGLSAGTGWVYYHQAGAAQPQAPAAAQKPRPGEQNQKQGLAAIEETLKKTTAELEVVRRELADLRKQNDEIAKSVGGPRSTGGEEENQEVLYEGKSANYWKKMFKDRSPDYRARAVRALGEIAPFDKSVPPLLVEALTDKRDPESEKSVWYTASVAMANLGKEAIPHLAKLLNSPDSETRFHAAYTARQVGEKAKELVPQLIRVLKDEKERLLTRSVAAQALGMIGPDANAAIPALVEASKHTDTGLRNAARIALESIRPTDPMKAPVGIPVP